MENIGAPPILSSTRSFIAPLLISMLGIVCTALALVIYHFILLRFCIRRSRSHIRNNIGQPFNEPHLTIGIEQKIIESIPLVVYSIHKQDLCRVDQNECAVCLGELEEGEIVRFLPNCKHYFHVTCIDKWLIGHVNCPICRSSIIETINYEEKDKPDVTIVPLPSNSPPCVSNESNTIDVQVQDQDHENQVDLEYRIASSSDQVKLPSQSCRLHCHSASLELPTERIRSTERKLVMGLKRSLSMDQTFIIIDREKLEDEIKSFSTSSCCSSSTD
ncbi:PREDICTED: RING-H2 finger protein ATL52-like [Nicotiana attenuata]|uniref:RING-type E3 ubiquitin transferase n=1 Tax=Nicotiana attenuata TaxID=49451 RepID=A0A1J6INI4_NICAT|nr:PREDICTED: RING-H2 finger protein ATL52-like [Nicotiana attenuata]OIT00403.1 ring-h2 finger protein atl52 [Nicotiana attenuata]